MNASESATAEDVSRSNPGIILEVNQVVPLFLERKKAPPTPARIQIHGDRRLAGPTHPGGNVKPTGPQGKIHLRGRPWVREKMFEGRGVGLRARGESRDRSEPGIRFASGPHGAPVQATENHAAADEEPHPRVGAIQDIRLVVNALVGRPPGPAAVRRDFPEMGRIFAPQRGQGISQVTQGPEGIPAAFPDRDPGSSRIGGQVNRFRLDRHQARAPFDHAGNGQGAQSLAVSGPGRAAVPGNLQPPGGAGQEPAGQVGDAQGGLRAGLPGSPAIGRMRAPGRNGRSEGRVCGAHAESIAGGGPGVGAPAEKRGS